MDRKKLTVVLALGCMIFISSATAKDKNFNPFPENKGTIYEYNSKDLPDICFFPAAKARWNGYAVTTKNWGQLTDFQKAKFIVEAITEIERNENAAIKPTDGFKMLMALSTVVDGLKKIYPGAKVQMIRLLFDFYSKNGLIKWHERVAQK